MEVTKHNRFLEILPGAVTWATIILPVVFSFIWPNAVAVFLLIFTTYWLYQSIEFCGFLIKTYRQYRFFVKLPWNNYLKYFSAQSDLVLDIAQEKHPKKRAFLTEIQNTIEQQRTNGTLKAADEIVHLVVMATYREDISILRTSIAKVAASHFDTKKIFFILAGERRDYDNASKNGQLLQEEFKDVFGGFYCTFHPDEVGEVRGKGANITYSARQVVPNFLQEHGFDPSNVLVTTLDADNCVHPMYFANLTFFYLLTPDRGKKAYQPLPLFYNNIWEVPVTNRMIAFGNSFWHMIESGRPHRLRNFSSHAQSLDALLITDFWSNQTIVEDGHQYWRSYFAFDGNYSVIPLFIPIYQDAVQNNTYFKTLWGQYKQLRRWAWGASDIPFVIENIRAKGNKLPFWSKYVSLYRLFEGHYMWATAPIIVTLTQPIPRVVNEQFATTVISYNLGITLSHFFTFALAGIFIAIWITLLMAPPIPLKKFKGHWWLRLSILLQWLFFPIITILFGSLPAIESQTRLMFGKYLDFQVTEKVRTDTSKIDRKG